MNTFEQFTALVTQHANGLSPEQLAVYWRLSTSGECVSPSYEVFRGYPARHPMEEFVSMASSRNAIRPDDYLGDLRRGPHQIIGALADVSTTHGASLPIYFFPGAGIYAAAVSDTEVLDVWMSWPCYPENW
ncbi:hypothetical protein DL738_20405 [Escherichia coli]|nr:hypothetical protein [Escherichia coli]EHS0389627.1 hypothetical protein [Salmonella enterica]